MRYILNNKIYDTEKSEEIMRYEKSIEHKGMFINTYPKYEHTLYKTAKGHFFVHIGKYLGRTDISYDDKDYIELLPEDTVKEILCKLNLIDKYTELFDDLEEG